MPVRNCIGRGVVCVWVAGCAAWGLWNSRGLQAQAAEPRPATFLAPVAFDTGDQLPADLERADFNDDGYLDLAIVTTQGSGKVTNFLLGDGAGRLLLDNTVTTEIGRAHV